MPGALRLLVKHVVDSIRRAPYNPLFRQLGVEVEAVAYAIIRTGDKQFRVTPGSVVRVPRITTEVGEKANFDVLVYGDGSDVKVGAPLVGGIGVEGTVLEHGRGEKIIVFKMKRRKGYKKKQG